MKQCEAIRLLEKVRVHFRMTMENGTSAEDIKLLKEIEEHLEIKKEPDKSGT